MITRTLAAALVATATPLAAGAQSNNNTCPTQADMQAGVLLSMDDGGFAMLSRTTPDGVEVTSIVTYSDGAIARTITTFEHPLALPPQVNAQGPTFSEYEKPLAGLDGLPNTRDWVSDFRFVRDGAVVETGTQTSRLTGFGQITVGECSYDVWRVHRQIRYSDGFALYAEHVYAPSLGIILGETTLDENGNPRAAVFFDEIMAE